MLWRFSSIGEIIKRMNIGKKVLLTAPTIYQKFYLGKKLFFLLALMLQNLWKTLREAGFIQVLGAIYKTEVLD